MTSDQVFFLAGIVVGFIHGYWVRASMSGSRR